MKSATRFMLHICIAAGICAQSDAALPEFAAIFPAGCRRGDTVEVTLAGKDLTGAMSLHFSRPGITASHMSDQIFRVQVDQLAELGNCDVWVATPNGLAGPRRFVVTSLPTFLEIESKNKLDKAQQITAPCELDGRLDQAADIDWFQFDCEQGEGYSILCHSRSIDGSVNPTMTLVAPDGQEIAHSVDARIEPALHFEASQSGPYRLRICDRAYRRDKYSFYRITIATGPRMLHVFPHVLNGSANQVTIHGLGLSPKSPKPNPLQQLKVTINPPEQRERMGRGADKSPFLDGFRYQREEMFGTVWFGLTTDKLVVDSTTNNTPSLAQTIALPCRVVGHIESRDDVDWYRFTAMKSQSVRVESFGDRGGLQMDLDIAIHDAKGKLLVTLPDLATPKGLVSQLFAGSLDAVGTWKAPSSGDYLMVVRDLYGGSIFGVDRTYEVAISSNDVQRRIYALQTDKKGASTVSAKPGQTMKLQIFAHPRTNSKAGIRVTAVDLPEGIEAAPVTLNAKDDAQDMELRIGKSAQAGVFPIELSAESDHESEKRKHPVVGLSSFRPGAMPRRIEQVLIHIRP